VESLKAPPNTYQAPRCQAKTPPLFAREAGALVDRSERLSSPWSPTSFPCLRCREISAPNTYRGSAAARDEAPKPRREWRV